MEKTLKKEKINGGLMGGSSVIAGFSFFQLITHLLGFGRYSYSLTFVVPVFVVSFTICVYTFYNARLLRRKRESEAAKKIQ